MRGERRQGPVRAEGGGYPVKALPDSAYQMPLPAMHRVRQQFDDTCLSDVADAVRQEFKRPSIASAVKPGMRTALLVGSRGIANLALIVRTAVDELKHLGAIPVIIPAMGSHGGATAEGQREVLAGYGITEETMGCPVESSMDVVRIGFVGRTEIFSDAAAAACDAIVPVGRIKPHTDFRGEVESGLCKMLTIGLGKHVGCTQLHRMGFENFSWLIPQAAAVVLEKLPVAFGIAVVENAYDRTMLVEALPAKDIPTREPQLLQLAKKNMPRLMFDEIDLLIIERLGKDISGAGMDPNITGRYYGGILPGFTGPRIRRILVEGLTEKTNGNACGIGYADLILRACYEQIDWLSTSINAISSGNPGAAKLPPVCEDEAEGIVTALNCAAGADLRDPRIVKIRSTLELTDMEVSDAMLSAVAANPDLVLVSGAEK